MNYKLDNDKQIFFYEQDYYVFSNFSSFKVSYCTQEFQTAEHAYHYQKFCETRFYDDTSDAYAAAQAVIRKQILETRSAHDAFKVANAHKQFYIRGWDELKINVMRKILEAKLQQHEYVKHKLWQSRGKELIEDSWRDDFWGWGPNKDGRNELGKLWMELRDRQVTTFDFQPHIVKYKGTNG